ncbi:MAG: hypothetical protein FJW95_04840 [Actinobacteria bacterium]|nr:hypothetical protein [Actinomycetota bacterium]
MTSGDPLGGIFSRIRDDVVDPEPGTGAGPEAAGAAPEPDDGVVAEVVVDDVRTLDGEAVAAGVADRTVPAGADDEFVVVAVDLVEIEPVEPEPHWPVFSVAESATLDDAALRRRRDAAISKALEALSPRVKRLLQDEQNELLDAVRRQKGKGDPVDAVPGEADQVAAWAEVFRPVVDDLYAAGRTLGGGRTRPAPDGLVAQLVALLVVPLRERVVASLESAMREGPYDGLPDLQRAIAGAVGARYREWRGQDLETALGDLSSWAFARGVFDATPDDTLLRWVPAEVEQCPDADDNALEPTCKGRPFPTGQSCPPAHAGCRCLVVPAG